MSIIQKLYDSLASHYDALLADKPPYLPPYIHKTEKGSPYPFGRGAGTAMPIRSQYIIDDENALGVQRFVCEYRATRREELTARFTASGCKAVVRLFPEETGFYQPIIVARK